eukprot:gene37306-45293_t
MSVPSTERTAKFSVYTHPLIARDAVPADSNEFITPEELSIFSTLYRDFPTSVSATRSLTERKTGGNPLTKNSKAGSLTYGEVVDMQLVHEVLKILKEDNLINESNTDCFYDLGSGSGKMVIAAALTQTFRHCVGLEILASLHDIASQVGTSYSHFLSENTNGKAYSTVEFHQSDILDLAAHDWTKAGCLYINSTCFDDVLMQRLQEIATEHMRSGSIIITLSAFWANKKVFEFIREIRHEMSWGMADIFIQRKL